MTAANLLVMQGLGLVVPSSPAEIVFGCSGSASFAAHHRLRPFCCPPPAPLAWLASPGAAQAIVEGFADSNEIRIVAKTDAFGRALIEVSDTGQGMSTDSLKNLFVPFHTTKAKSGTGLGLTISKSIVNDLGGEIDVQSELGKGTCFRVVLPPAETRPPISVCGDSTAPSSEGKRGKVLVIDDELSIVQAFARALETGHDVTGCTLAEEALGLIGAGNRYDVIFCDLLMPQMTGMDFYAKLEGVFPQEAKKVIFLTGGVFTARASSFMEQVPNRLVHKPVDALGIQALVRCLVARVGRGGQPSWSPDVSIGVQSMIGGVGPLRLDSDRNQRGAETS